MDRPYSFRILPRTSGLPVRCIELVQECASLKTSITVLPIVHSVASYHGGLGSALAKRTTRLIVLRPLAASVLDDLSPVFRALDQPDIVLLDCHTVRGAVMCRSVARIRLAGWRGPIFVIAGDETLSRIPVAMTLGAAEFGLPTTPAAEIEVRLSRLVALRDESVTALALPDGSRLSIHWRQHLVICDDIRVSLTLRELQLFGALVENVGRTLSAAEIAGLAWGRAGEPESTTVVYVSNLRKKLAWFGSRLGIRTIRGLGYRFEMSTESSRLTTRGVAHDE